MNADIDDLGIVSAQDILRAIGRAGICDKDQIGIFRGLTESLSMECFIQRNGVDGYFHGFMEDTAFQFGNIFIEYPSNTW